MRGAPASSGADRISQLPDAVLHSILSLLPLDAAATTAVLSRRWRRLFPTLPDLHFSPQSFSPTSPFAKVTFFPNNWFAAAAHILNSRRCRLGRTSLRFSYNEDFKCEIDDITFSLCALGIRELAIDNYADEDRYTIPSYVFFCPSLKKLEAKSCNLVNCSSVMSLYRMRSLDLFDVVVSEEHIEKLVSSCRELEELSIRHCPGLRRIVIRSQSLSRLEVQDTRPLDISIEKAPCLLAVHASFCDKIEDSNEEEEEEVEEEDEEVDLVSWLVRLLDGLSCVEDLGLSFGEEYVKCLIGRGMPLPKKLPIGNRLMKLKKLHLSMPFANGYLISILSCLLNSSPNVEELLIDEIGSKGYTRMVKAKYLDQCKPLESIVNWPTTTTLRLGYKQLKHWIEFTKYLLMNACTLKKMNIFYSSLQTAEALELSEFENDKKKLLLLQKDFPHVVLKLTSG